MVKHISYIVCLLFLCNSCCKDYTAATNPQLCDVIVSPCLEPSTTKTIVGENNKVYWKQYDEIGVCAVCVNSTPVVTSTCFQTFKIYNRAQIDSVSQKADFVGKLPFVEKGDYQIFGLYPYTSFISTSSFPTISFSLPQRQYPDKNSFDSRCDILVAKPYYLSNVASLDNLKIPLAFHRLFGVFNLSLSQSVYEAYKSDIVETVRLESLDETDVLSGDFTVNLTEGSHSPEFDPVNHSNSILLDYSGQYISLDKLSSYFVIKPGEYQHIRITIETNHHSFTFSRDNLKIAANVVTSATLSNNSSDKVSSKSPLLPENPTELNVLVFGHSYAIYSLQLLDELLQSAGVTKLTIANFYEGSCSLQRYEQLVKADSNIAYFKIKNGQHTVQYSRKPSQVLIEEPWDIIVFQHDQFHNGLYETFDPSLSYLIDHVKDVCSKQFGREPLIGWHMYWAFANFYVHSSYTASYSGDQDINFAAHISAAKRLLQEGRVDIVIPTGTAVQSLRNSEINNSSDFTFDGFHCDYGGGSYSTACTWFESLVTPCFGISVLGNTFVPTSTNCTTYADAFSTRSKVTVTNENRIQMQRAAINAVAHKFEILSVGKPSQEDPPSGDPKSKWPSQLSSFTVEEVENW